MKIKFISPIGKYNPTLFPSFLEVLKMEGHTIVDKIEDADTVFFDMFSGLGNYFIREWDVILQKRLPIVFFDESDYGGCQDETAEWFGFKEPTNYDDIPQWQDIYWQALGYCQVIYFMRKKYKNSDFPKFVYPYELCMYKDCIFEPVSMDELFNRPFDIYFAGNTSPARRKVYEGLKDTGLKLDWHWTHEQGKLPHDEWISRARRSKMFLSADGGGMNDERAYQLIYIAALLKQDNNQIVLHDFRDGIECLRIAETPSRIDIENIKAALCNKERLYSMYLKGIERTGRYFNPSYRAQYILDTLKNNGIE